MHFPDESCKGGKKEKRGAGIDGGVRLLSQVKQWILGDRWADKRLKSARMDRNYLQKTKFNIRFGTDA